MFLEEISVRTGLNLNRYSTPRRASTSRLTAKFPWTISIGSLHACRPSMGKVASRRFGRWKRPLGRSCFRSCKRTSSSRTTCLRSNWR